MSSAAAVLYLSFLSLILLPRLPQVQVAFSVVKYETPSGTRVGVATTWLDKILQPLLAKTTAQLPQWLPVYLRSGGGFRPPASLQSPVIMIGPGTGVAPFRGFLQVSA